MTRLLAAVAAVCLAIPALGQPKDPPKETPAEAASKALNGTYTLKELNFDGRPAPEDLKAEVTAVEIKDGVIIARSAKRDDPAKFTVDPAKKPAAIDITPDGDKPKPGIYLLDKGELTIVFSDKGERPTDLKATGEGLRRMVLVKKKEEPKKEEPKKDPPADKDK